MMYALSYAVEIKVRAPNFIGNVVTTKEFIKIW